MEHLGLQSTHDHVMLDQPDDPVVLLPTLSAETFSKAIDFPIIVASWANAVGPRASGSLKRKFHKQFTEDERERLGHYHQMFRKWHLTEGTPHRITVSIQTIRLLKRAVAFFADPDRKPSENPPLEVDQNQGEKRPFIVNIYDRDMQREMDIETWAVSPRKAEANAWFRLMKMEGFTGSVGVFRSRYGERYRIQARNDADAAQEREGARPVGENYKPATETMTLILESLPNPDFGQSRPLSPPQKVKIKSVEEGRRVCQQYIVQYGLGGGNWRGKAGHVNDASGNYLGRFSYNGRWWPSDEEEE